VTSSRPPPPPPRRRIVTPAWTKIAPPAAPDPPPRKDRRRRKSTTETRTERPPLPSADGVFITQPGALLAFLGEFGFEVPPPADVVPADNAELDADEASEEPEEIAVDADEASDETEATARSPHEVAALCRQHLAFADGVASEVHARMGDRVLLGILKSAARTGLWHAARRFDPARNVPFEAFAKRRVAGAIIDALRVEHLVPRLRGTRSAALVALLSGCSYASKPEAFATAEDIAWIVSWRAVSGVEAIPIAGLVSLSGAVDRDCVAADDALDRAKVDATLLVAIASLKPRERALVDGVYFRGLTIAESTDVSRSHGSRILAEALGRLKRAMLRAGYRERFASDAIPATEPRAGADED
jgi:RNA polymerase sigma factor for flagellar operon FliA